MSGMVTQGSDRVYNSLEVVGMNSRQRAVRIIEELSEKKLMAALYILEQLALEEEGANKIGELLNESIELLGSLKVAESAFSEWDNDEDSVYDQV